MVDRNSMYSDDDESFLGIQDDNQEIETVGVESSSQSQPYNNLRQRKNINADGIHSQKVSSVTTERKHNGRNNQIQLGNSDNTEHETTKLKRINQVNNCNDQQRHHIPHNAACQNDILNRRVETDERESSQVTQNTFQTIQTNGFRTMFQEKIKKYKVLNSVVQYSSSNSTIMLIVLGVLLNATMFFFLVHLVHSLQKDFTNLQLQSAESVSQQQQFIMEKMNQMKTQLIDTIEEKHNSGFETLGILLKNTIKSEFDKFNLVIERRQNYNDDEMVSAEQDLENQALLHPPEIKKSGGSMFSWLTQSEDESQTPNHDKIELLKKELNQLKELHFPNQLRETWIQILSSVAMTLETSSEPKSITSSPERPSVILILQKASQSQKFGACFTKALAASINKVIGSEENTKIKYIGPNYFQNFPSLTDIHEDLNCHLKNYGKVIVVNDINLIHAEEHLLLFHSFCDNYMAPDPKAVFLFLVTIPMEDEDHLTGNWNHWNGGDIAHEFLNRAWEDALTEDKRAALIARVAPSVILLKNPSNNYVDSAICA